VSAEEVRQFMKNKLLIVADLGLVKAYKVEFTLEQHTPRLEQLEELVLEDAHAMRTPSPYEYGT